VAFHLATGSVKWKTEGEGPACGSPVLVTIDGTNQIVYQSLTKLVSLDMPDGRLLWEYDTPVGDGEIAFQSFGSLIDAGSLIVGLSGNSKFMVLNPDGQKFDAVSLIELTEKGIYAHPILSGNRIFIKDEASLILFTL